MQKSISLDKNTAKGEPWQTTRSVRLGCFSVLEPGNQVYRSVSELWICLWFLPACWLLVSAAHTQWNVLNAIDPKDFWWNKF